MSVRGFGSGPVGVTTDALVHNAPYGVAVGWSPVVYTS